MATRLVFLFAAAALLSCGASKRPEAAGDRQGLQQPAVLNWDLSRSHELADIGWDGPAADDYLHRQGDFDLTLQLPGGRVFRHRVRDIFCKRNGRAIETLMLAAPNMTLEEAYGEAKQMIEYWKFDRKNLDEWYRLNETGRENENLMASTKFETNLNDAHPALSLKIIKVLNEQKHWFIQFEASWIIPTAHN